MLDMVIFMASKTVGGKTEKLLKFYLKKMQKKQQKLLKFKLVNLYDFKILPCDGCGFCADVGTCLKNKLDDFLKLICLITRANCFVLASNIYFLGFPAQLKAFIDRCEQFYCEKKQKFEKVQNFKFREGHLVLTSGNLKFNFLSYILQGCLQFFNCLDVEFKSCLVAPRTDFDGLFFLVNEFF